MKKNNLNIKKISYQYLNKINHIIQNSNITCDASLLTTQEKIINTWNKTIVKPLKKIPESNLAKQNLIYPLAAYTDEAAFDLPHDNRLSWSAYSIQQKHFQTSNAGTEFFSRLEKIITSSNPELSAAYLLCLQHGFCGKHKNGEGKKTTPGPRNETTSEIQKIILKSNNKIQQAEKNKAKTSLKTTKKTHRPTYICLLLLSAYLTYAHINTRTESQKILNKITTLSKEITINH